MWSAFFLFGGLYLIYSLSAAIIYPLRRVPGPLLARVTRFWYLRRVRCGRFHLENLKLHRKHGKHSHNSDIHSLKMLEVSVVRIATNQYIIDDPGAIRPIYGHATQFTKVGAFDLHE